MAVPIAGGGRSSNPGSAGKTAAQMKQAKTKKVGRRVVSVKPMTDPAYEDAFNLFRQTMGALRKYTPAVDTAGISQPYTDATAAAASLSTGLANATNEQTQKSLASYGQARDAAASNVSAFGAAAGGPSNTPIQDRGSALLAEQGQANATAALQAGPAQAQLLERARAGAIARAQQGRDQVIQAGIAGAAANIPGVTQQNRTRNFQQNVADQNYLLALGTQKDKQTESYRQFLLGKLKAEQTGQYQAGQLELGQGNLALGQDRLAETTAHDSATEQHWAAQLAKANRVAKAASLKGVPGAIATLRGPKGASTKKQQGFVVGYQTADEDGAYGTLQYAKGVPQNWQPPAGTKIITPAQPYYVTGNAPGAKFSWSRYKAAVGQLRGQNPAITPQQIVQILGPTPSTKKKK